jgi:hypothetical protein
MGGKRTEIHAHRRRPLLLPTGQSSDTSLLSGVAIRDLPERNESRSVGFGATTAAGYTRQALIERLLVSLYPPLALASSEKGGKQSLAAPSLRWLDQHHLEQKIGLRVEPAWLAPAQHQAAVGLDDLPRTNVVF